MKGQGEASPRKNIAAKAGPAFAVGRVLLVLLALYAAYSHRLHAIETFGLVIHEFDPWFNFRATKYLAENGMEKFFSWFDYKVWYPLGRPVGTTIYPGMQISSVFIWNALEYLGMPMSLNDVCCYVPAWFGCLATALLGMMTYECSGSANAAVVSSLIMSIVPAHMMRSVGGGYDNESVAVSAMVAVFYLWCRSLRGGCSWLWGALAGLAYIYMVAAWGGYIFVLNMVGFHACILVALGRYSSKLHRAYSLFYIIGTFGAVHVPVVGWTPLKSLEQLPCLGIFGALQLLEICAILKRRLKLDEREHRKLQVKAFVGCALLVATLAAVFLPPGYLGPISSRVRGLFLRHTRTGNPLVDSVAEHQPASNRAYFQYLHSMCYFAPIGFVITCREINDAKIFLLCYGVIAYFFSAKMVRLVLLLGPIASSLGGVAISTIGEWIWRVVVVDTLNAAGGAKNDSSSNSSHSGGNSARRIKGKKIKRGKKSTAAANATRRRPPPSTPLDYIIEQLFGPVLDFFETPSGGVVLRSIAIAIGAVMFMNSMSFYRYSASMAIRMSNPSIMFQANLRNGDVIMIDDYREAYWWLRDNTPEDSRVMAWWDYGYQITGIGERTTIADGNTWNHEHIATLGRCLVSPEAEAHKIVRHLADYVLIWTGGGGDDLAKSPHMARISNSVYSDICPGDPTCKKFGFMDREMTPKPMMAASLLYKLHGHNQKPGVQVDPSRFEEVYTSKYNKVRIFKVLDVDESSKAWVANPANLKCDAPGSWYCPGQYPPAIQEMFVTWNKKAFRQLEDFNVERDQEAEEYHEAYMAAMSGRRGQGGGEGKNSKKSRNKKRNKAKKRPASAAAGDNSESSPEMKWQNTEDTTRLWKIIQSGDVELLEEAIDIEPYLVHVRSEDGRGPLFWAHERGNDAMVDLLISNGADPEAEDATGLKPGSF
eukprot:g2343.t1